MLGGTSEAVEIYRRRSICGLIFIYSPTTFILFLLRTSNIDDCLLASSNPVSMTSNSFSPFHPSTPGVFHPAGPSPTFNPPQTEATAHFRLNHLALRITDPARSLHFYVDLLGMRVIFTFNGGPFTIYYLGHPPPDTADPMSEIPNLMAAKGLLELYHVHGTESNDSNDGHGTVLSTGNTPPHLGFHHLGFSVPDVRLAVERLRTAGVPIRKDLGTCSRESIPLSEWEAEQGIGRGEIHANYAWFIEKFAIVEDPVSCESCHPVEFSLARSVLNEL